MYQHHWGTIKSKEVQTLKDLAKVEIRYTLYKNHKYNLYAYKTKVEKLPLPTTLKSFIYSELLITQKFVDQIRSVLGENPCIYNPYGPRLRKLLETLKPDIMRNYKIVILQEKTNISKTAAWYTIDQITEGFHILKLMES
jgi:hypothetical protein